MNSKSKIETEECIDTTTVIQKVPIIRPVVNLVTLEDYKDRKSIADALMDDDFSSPVLDKIAEAIQQEDPKKRKKILTIMQRKCGYLDLKKIQQALDDKGYAYDTQNRIVGWKNARALAHCFAHRIKIPNAKNNTEKKKKDTRKKTSICFSRTPGRSLG